MRNAGASEVHMRISSPPIKFPDYYGIDTPSKNELIASKNSAEEIRKILKLDSLHFLSLDGLYHSMGHKKRDINNPQFTDHCFTGDYPTKLKDQSSEDNIRQLSLLFETEKE